MRLPFTRLIFVSALLAVVGYAFVTLRGPQGIPALLEKKAMIETLEKRNAAMAQEIERKRERIKRLGDNPAEQELEIRQRLKFVHPGEKVYILGEGEKK
jgi:cell division protein FtsB